MARPPCDALHRLGGTCARVLRQLANRPERALRKPRYLPARAEQQHGLDHLAAGRTASGLVDGLERVGAHQPIKGKAAGAIQRQQLRNEGLGVLTWAFSEIKFQSDMGILLTFMFLWNMVGAVALIPAIAAILNVGGRQPVSARPS